VLVHDQRLPVAVEQRLDPGVDVGAIEGGVAELEQLGEAGKVISASSLIQSWPDCRAMRVPADR
jgi:coenzyme F420-reducing hydrogenase gamma subunit